MRAVSSVPAITTARLELEAMTPVLLGAFLVGDREGAPFSWPTWWPDDADRRHVELWLERSDRTPDQWAPRAVVDRATRSMVGHAGFHRPPCPLDEALADSTFEGDAEPSAGGVVEIGYTIFPDGRRQGFATEAVRALVEWAFASAGLSTVLATVATDNDASHGVLRAVGGFHLIGTCRDDDGTVEDVYRRDRVA